MTFPDWGTAIAAQTQTFLNWSAIADPIKLVIGVAVGAVIVSLFLKVFMHGG